MSKRGEEGKSGKIVWIDKSLENMEQIDLTKHAIRVFTNNMLSLHKYSDEEKRLLADYFLSRILEKPEYDQTS